MVDAGNAPKTLREACTGARVRMPEHTLALIKSGGYRKGDVIAAARIAGIQAARRCADLIPLCHPLMLARIDVYLELDKPGNRVPILKAGRLKGATGVVMEALTAASVTAMTVYGMGKADDRPISIGDVCLLHKSSGRSGERDSGQVKNLRRTDTAARASQPPSSTR